MPTQYTLYKYTVALFRIKTEKKLAIQFDKASLVSSLPCLIVLHSTSLETHHEMQEKSIVLLVDMTFRIRSFTYHTAFHFKSDIGCS